jgi:hypothetical protein
MDWNQKLGTNVSMICLLGLTLVTATVVFISDKARDVINKNQADIADLDAKIGVE